MSQSSTPPPGQAPTPRPRVLGWLKALNDAGPDMQKAQLVLNGIRDDQRASKADKEHFYRALAQQSYVWYLGALRGQPVTAEELKEKAKQAADKQPAPK